MSVSESVSLCEREADNQTFRLLIIDACGLSTAEYDTYKKDFLHDLEDDRVHSALHMYHNWGWRI
jgi:hypothetical protein